jgi:hypothetical protein
VAPPEQPKFYEAVRWLERVEESGHPSAPHAVAALAALRPAYYHEKDDDLTDTALGIDTFSHCLLALKVQDLANLQTVTHNMPNVRNHGVAVRRLINREAKRLREGNEAI